MEQFPLDFSSNFIGSCIMHSVLLKLQEPYIFSIQGHISVTSQVTFTSSKSAIETPKKV